MAEKILITGVSGCIGEATVAWLREQGFEDIVGMTRSGEAEGMECVAGDVSDFGTVESVVSSVRPTRIIHLAAISLRLATTYGPGRDRGLTAAPTTAIFDSGDVFGNAADAFERGSREVARGVSQRGEERASGPDLKR